MIFSGFFKWKIKNKHLRRGLKSLLSCFIIYHLAMIFIVPHKMSMMHERLLPYFIPYAHTLSMIISWDFYAPNPSLYHYFEYEVIDSKDTVDTFRWPPSRKEFKRIYLNHNRLIFHTRFFMLAGKKNIRRHFVPYLCRLHPSASEITIKVIFENRPHFKKAQVFKSGFFSAKNMENMKEIVTISSKCKRSKKSRNINSQDDPAVNEDRNRKEKL